MFVFAGEFCEMDVDECSRDPGICKNGATCLNNDGGYTCICVNGFSGKNCSINIDDCNREGQENPCYNGGTCYDRVGYYHCKCPRGKTGELKI